MNSDQSSSGTDRFRFGYYCDNCEDSGVIPVGDFAEGDDCPNCDGDPLNALPHEERPHPPDYDCPDCPQDTDSDQRQLGDLSPEEAAFGHVRRSRETDSDRDRAQLTAAGWITYAAVCALTLATSFVIGVML